MYFLVKCLNKGLPLKTKKKTIALPKHLQSAGIELHSPKITELLLRLPENSRAVKFFKPLEDFQGLYMNRKEERQRKLKESLSIRIEIYFVQYRVVKSRVRAFGHNIFCDALTRTMRLLPSMSTLSTRGLDPQSVQKR